MRKAARPPWIPSGKRVIVTGGLGERYFMHTPLGPVVEPTLRALSIVYTVAERADAVSSQISRAQTLAIEQDGHEPFHLNLRIAPR